MFLAFPCEQSVSLPSRKGTLCFYDDPSHMNMPHLAAILRTIQEIGITVDFCSRRYRPPIPFLVGLLLEPFSHILGRTLPGRVTWSFYGFETIIWLHRADQ